MLYLCLSFTWTWDTVLDFMPFALAVTEFILRKWGRQAISAATHTEVKRPEPGYWHACSPLWFSTTRETTRPQFEFQNSLDWKLNLCQWFSFIKVSLWRGKKQQKLVKGEYSPPDWHVWSYFVEDEHWVYYSQESLDIIYLTWPSCCSYRVIRCQILLWD